MRILLPLLPLCVILAVAVSGSSENETQDQEISQYAGSRSLAQGNFFTCVSIVETDDDASNIRACRRSCKNNENCMSAKFDNDENECHHLIKNDEGVAEFCVRTREISGESRATFMCNRGSWYTEESVEDKGACLVKCKRKRLCKNALYDSGEKRCTMYGKNNKFGRRNSTMGSGVKCDKKEALRSSIVCPCFDSGTAQDAVTSINEGENELQEGSCIYRHSPPVYGLYYAPPSDGLNVASRLINSESLKYCDNGLTVRENLVNEETNACQSILVDACEALSVVEEESLTPVCPCFDLESVQGVVDSINEGSQELKEGSCVTGDGGLYELKYGPAGGSIGVNPTFANNLSANYCDNGNTATEDLASEESDACNSILVSACEGLTSGEP